MVTRVSNPPNPWESTHADWLGEPPEAKLEVFEEHARSIIAENDSPDIGFRFSVNPYRGCFHACAYCLSGDTPILMGDGRTKALADLRVGDELYGTRHAGRYRRYVKTTVLAHWTRIALGCRVVLEDGTQLVASADHRFLTNRGWKYVAGAEQGRRRRPYLTIHNDLVGTGRFAKGPEETGDYRMGYLCGVIRGDGLLVSSVYDERRRASEVPHPFRLAVADAEALERTRRYLDEFEIATREFMFQAAVAGRRPLAAIRTQAGPSVARIREIVRRPSEPSLDWSKGFLAGIFDAEGSYSRGILRICNKDRAIIEQITEALARFAFEFAVETRDRDNPVHVVRARHGVREHLRFFHTIDPAIRQKLSIEGQAIKNDSALRIVAVEPMGVALRLFDITTGTGDFIANGVLSHNCYARPSHQYLGFGAGTDFERKIVVKVNAPELLRRELSRRSWQGETIVFSGNTDCYQPLEAVYGLTRRCLEVCEEFRNPVAVITKGALVRRDVELLARMAHKTPVSVGISIAFADDGVSRELEPGTSPPSQRFETLRILSEAGLQTAIAVAPVIPGLNDSDIAELLERARRAGARSAFITLLRLPAEVLPVFRERLEAAFPDRAPKIWSAVREVRGGKLNESAFGRRMHGEGPRWEAISSLFEAQCRRLGLNAGEDAEMPSGFRSDRQASLFPE
ncbi:MAG: radical SAM protein [Thermoanaerobaculia bacterium]